MDLKELLKKIKFEFDSYRLSTLVSLPIALILMVAALGVAAYWGIEDLVKASALAVDFVVIPAFVARLISASSYIGRLVDAWNKDMRRQADKAYVMLSEEEGVEIKPLVTTVLAHGVKTDRVIANWERWGTTLGVALGCAIGIAAAVLLGAAVPLSSTLSIVAYPLYVAGFIGVIGGLFNRVGLIIDNRIWLKKVVKDEAAKPELIKGNRDKAEIVLMLVGTLLGLAFGMALLATSSSTLVAIGGITPFLAAGIFPAWLAGAVLILVSMSIFASAADYIAKSVSYIRTYFDQKLYAKLLEKQLMHEHRGAFVGMLLGVGLGVAASVLLALTTMPLVGIAGAAIAMTIIMTTIGLMGGLVARIARLVDRLTPPTNYSKVRSKSPIPADSDPAPTPGVSEYSSSPGASPVQDPPTAGGWRMSIFEKRAMPAQRTVSTQDIVSSASGPSPMPCSMLSTLPQNS